MKTRLFRTLFSLGLSAALPSATAFAAETLSSETLAAPLFDGLGNHRHPITTESKLAQRYFDQGLTLCFAFNHKEAIRSFQGALAHDPNCAMAHWGIAYAYGPHVNKPMSKEENDHAWVALQKAVKLKPNAGAKDQAYIIALAHRYRAEFAEDRSTIDKGYAAAMRSVVKDYPEDLDAHVLLAEALMDTMPWDYWLKDRSPKPETDEAITALRFVMARNANHPGANHLYIHAVEAGPNPGLALRSADRLLNFAPQAGHLVHMPAHIYMRVGQYHDAVLANERAIAADESFIRHCKAQGFYPGVYYPHNVHFIWYANLFVGRSSAALAAAQKAAEIAADNYCGPSKALEAPRFRHLPWLTWARFGYWDEILRVAQPPSTNDFLIDRVMWHFTRGLAFAANQHADDAAREHTEMVKLIRSDDAKKLDSPQFPAVGILAVADHWLAGKAAGARGDSRAMIEHLERAVAAEDALPYMEPAYWPLPVRPTLGAAWLQAGDAAKAEQIFREDLKLWPRNGWGLLGLENSLRTLGKTREANAVRRQFNQAWKRADVNLKLGWF